MRIIIESGATKSAWRICSGSAVVDQFSLGGMNLTSMSPERIKSVLGDGLRKSGLNQAAALYLYAAGVADQDLKSELSAFIRTVMAVDIIDIQDDMVAAARSVCGHAPGIVAILGTGSNTCWYDGREIHHKVYSGGYIIGDFGSASVLGKIFLTDFIKNRVPADVADAFKSNFDSSYADIVSNVYKSQAPAAYLGSLAPFIVSNYNTSAYIRDLVDSNFKTFIETSLKAYEVDKYPVGVVGGFGYACKDIFAQLCKSYGITISSFIKDPIDNLALWQD